MAARPPPLFRIPTAKQIAARFRRMGIDRRVRRQKRRYRRRDKGGTAPSLAAFVVGCQRSGTDMTLWTLDRSLDVDRYDEDSRAAFVRCRIKGKKVRDRLIARSEAKRVIFKPVCDSHRTRTLLSQHEGSRAIWVYRDFRDVAHSAVVRWGEMNKEHVLALAAGSGDWGWHQWNRELMEPRYQREVQQFCAEDLNALSAAAVFWYLVNRTFFDQGLQENPGVRLVKYEDVVSSPVEAFRGMCAFLDVAFSEDMVDDVFATSVRKKDRMLITPRVRDACEDLLQRLDRVTGRGRSDP